MNINVTLSTYHRNRMHSWVCLRPAVVQSGGVKERAQHSLHVFIEYVLYTEAIESS